MIITKVLMTSIDLLNPNDMYNADVDGVIMKFLKNRYVKKCYQSMLILEVVKILKRSSLQITDNRLDAGASVDVQFEVSGIVLMHSEVLHGCKILEIRDDIITAEHEYAGIKLQKDPSGQITRILQVGQVIPVIVQNVRYTINESRMSVLATPYAPSASHTIPYYIVTDGVTPDNMESLETLMNMVDDEEKLHATLSKEAQYGFFKDILYPYKTRQKFEYNKALESFKPVALELKQLLTIDHGVVTYPDLDERINKRLLWSKQHIDTTSNNIVIHNSAYGIFTDILTKYLLYLQALRGFMETYPTPEEAKKIVSYWSVCKKLLA